MFSSSAKHAAGVVVGQGHILRLRRCIHTTPYNALMPRTVHASITSQQQVALATLRRRPDLKPVERDRIEMILLSARGWTVQQLSAHLQYHGETQGAAAGCGPAPHGHSRPAAVVAGTARMVFPGIGFRAGHALSDPAQCPVDPPVLAGNGRHLSAH